MARIPFPHRRRVQSTSGVPGIRRWPENSSVFLTPCLGCHLLVLPLQRVSCRSSLVCSCLRVDIVRTPCCDLRRVVFRSRRGRRCQLKSLCVAFVIVVGGLLPQSSQMHALIRALVHSLCVARFSLFVSRCFFLPCFCVVCPRVLCSPWSFVRPLVFVRRRARGVLLC